MTAASGDLTTAAMIMLKYVIYKYLDVNFASRRYDYVGVELHSWTELE